MVQRTIVLKLSDGDKNDKIRAKALKILAASKGNIAGVSFDKEFMKVIGDVDAANLTMKLRKKNINAEIDTVETPKPKPEAKEEKKEDKKEEPKPLSYPSYIQGYYPK